MAPTDDRARLTKLIKGIRIAMMSTVDEDGRIHSRPMATIEAKFDGQLWFMTDVRSHKVHELEREHHVNLDYVKQDDERFVSVSGQASLVLDREKVKQLWKPWFKAWFPDGVEDKNLALVRVDVDRAHYWEATSGKLVQLLGLVKAIATGERVKAGDDHELSFH